MYLLDTVILSELRKRNRNPGVERWIRQQRTTDLHLSVVTIGEVERGIRLQQRRNPEFAQRLARWLDQVLLFYDERILPVDLAVSRRWGALSATIGNDGADLLIAATALEHGLTVVTRNQRHFAPTGATVLDPFS